MEEKEPKPDLILPHRSNLEELRYTLWQWFRVGGVCAIVGLTVTTVVEHTFEQADEQWGENVEDGLENGIDSAAVGYEDLARDGIQREGDEVKQIVNSFLEYLNCRIDSGEFFQDLVTTTTLPGSVTDEPIIGIEKPSDCVNPLPELDE